MQLQSPKRIVILGAGFAGIKISHTLARAQLPCEFEIVLIEEKTTHIYTPDLYEIATAFSPKITEQCLTRLKDTVAIPLNKIIPQPRITLLRDTVTAIDPKSNAIELKIGGTLPFEYLAVCLGSVTNYYDIPGLEQCSYPLKTLTDALAIDCHLDSFFQTLWKNKVKKEIHIVIGGGGATGVEFACELPGYIKKLCAKYAYRRDDVHVTLIEASPFLCAAGEKGTRIIEGRCAMLGIRIMRDTYIRKVTQRSVTVESKKNGSTSLATDILIWAGGVMAHPLVRKSFDVVAENGALPVNHFLQSLKHSKIYAAGDSAYFAPMLAQIAIQEGERVALNIVADIRGTQKKHFVLGLKGVIIPLGGRYAYIMRGTSIYKGFFVWMLRRFVDLAYSLSILPFFYALKKWIRSTTVFLTND